MRERHLSDKSVLVHLCTDHTLLFGSLHFVLRYVSQVEAICKNSDQPGDGSPWLAKFFSKHGIPVALMDILAKTVVTSEAIFASITEQDSTDMRLVVGHKVTLRGVLSTLTKFSASATALATSLTNPATPDDPNVSPFKLADELAKIEAEFEDLNAAPSATPHRSQPPASTKVDGQAASTSSDSTGPEGKPLLPSDLIYGSNGKQLKPLQLTFAQFMLANFKILQTLIANNPLEASDYLKYLTFLSIKGTRFQTRAILTFDQDYRATKTHENFCCGSNVDDLSAQYFDAAVAF